MTEPTEPERETPAALSASLPDASSSPSSPRDAAGDGAGGADHPPRRWRGALKTFLQGLWVGGTMTVPGVSGGSMAIIIGCYDQLIASVSNIFKRPRQSIAFLAVFLLGGGLGIASIAKLMSDVLLARFALPTRWFFVGAVAGGVPLIWRESRLSKLDWRTFAFPALGLLLVFLAAQLPDGLFALGAGGLKGLLLQLLGGVIVALALVLPGISTSQMLLMLGLYEEIVARVAGFDFLPLVPFALSLLVGTFLVTRALERLHERHPQATYMVILGFVLGSLVELFPGAPASGGALAVSIAAARLGFALLYGLSRIEGRRGEGTAPRG